MKTLTVEISAPALTDDVTAEALRLHVEEYFLRRCARYAPDRRIDWSQATCVVTEIPVSRTPVPK